MVTVCVEIFFIYDGALSFCLLAAFSVLDDDVIDLDFDQVLVSYLERRLGTQIFAKSVPHDGFESLVVPLVGHYEAFDVVLLFRKDRVVLDPL